MKDKLKDFMTQKEIKAFEINNQINQTNCEDQVKDSFTDVERNFSKGLYNETNVKAFAQDFNEFALILSFAVLTVVW